jgi:integration host factor subunit beta
MTKADLIVAIADQLKLPAGRAELIVDQIFDGMVNALKRGDNIEIRGFGSFTIREYKAYEGRNPRTGETVHVKPKRMAFFRVGKELRERVNEGRGELSPDDDDDDDEDEQA